MAAPRMLQWLNARIHREPVASIIYSLYWSTIFLVAPPILVFGLQVQLAWKLLNWLLAILKNNETEEYPRRGDNNSQEQLAVVITGCDSGFGKELSLVAAQEGFVVFAGCLQTSSFAQFEHATTASSSIFPLLLDVTSDEQVQQAKLEVEKWLKKESIGANENNKPNRVLHALVNNAGIGSDIGDVDLNDIKSYQKTMDVNYFGMVRCCKAFLPLFKQQAYLSAQKQDIPPAAPRILNVTSMAGIVKAVPGMSSYCASKHAAVAFSTALRQELHGFGIQVCTVCPSFHATPLVDSWHLGVQKNWNDLPKQVRDEYGDGCLEYFVNLGNRAQFFSWSVDTAIEELMKGLKRPTVPPEMIIGLDARYTSPLVTMLPSWLVDWGNRAGVFLPLRAQPRAMKASRK